MSTPDLLQLAAIISAPQDVQSLYRRIIQAASNEPETARAWLFLDTFGVTEAVADPDGQTAPAWCGEVPVDAAPLSGTEQAGPWQLVSLEGDLGRTGVLALERPASAGTSALCSLAAHMGNALASAANYAMLEDLVQQEMATAVAREERIQLILDNMTEGLLVVDLQGAATAVRSAAVARWLGDIPEEGAIWDWLAGGDEQLAATFSTNFEQLTWEFLPFELCADQMPERVSRDGNTYSLRYSQVFENGEFNNVLITIQDITAQLKAEADAESRRELEEVVRTMLADSDGFRAAVDDLSRLLEELADIAEDDLRKRVLHTIKGNSALLGFRRFAQQVHHIEDQLAEDEPWSATMLEALCEGWAAAFAPVQSLVVSNDDMVRLSHRERQDFREKLAKSGVPESLLEVVDGWTAPTVGSAFRRFARAAERVCERSGKRIKIVSEGDEVRLRGMGQTSTVSALVHVVRNALDHGIETPDDRMAAGKPPEGTLRFIARDLGKALEIEIVDDGRGIDIAKVNENAVAAGLPSDAGLFQKLCAGSTRDSVTELSGRGVGMAAVGDVIEAMGGSVQVKTAPGRGTRFTFQVPTHCASDAEERAAV